MKFRRPTFLPALMALLLCAITLLPAAPARAASGLADRLKLVSVGEVFPGADRLGPVAGTPPAAPAYKGQQLEGYVYLNSDVVNSTGYSGKPINILIGIDTSGRIVGAKLMDHAEPIVLIGIPAAKLTAFIASYIGLNYAAAPKPGIDVATADIISGATVTTMVIGDGITRSARRVAQAYRLGNAMAAPVAAPAEIRRVNETAGGAEDWPTLLGDGSVRRLALSVGDVNRAFAGSGNPLAASHPEPGPDDDSYIDLYTALVSVPAIGRSLLGAERYAQLKSRLKPGQQAILVAGSGRYSFKGSGYVRGGIFDRIELVQGDTIIRFRDRNHQRLGDIAAQGAPGFPEIALFTIPDGDTLDPVEPWRLVLLAQRAIGARDKAFISFDLGYTLPAKYVVTERAAVPPAPAAAAAAPATAQAQPQTAGDADEQPLWVRIWLGKIVQVAILAVALLALTGIFFFQDMLVRRPKLYRRLRIAFLLFTLLWIGWYAHAQLSVVNVLTFVSALRGDFRWDYFLMDPLVFMLWCSVAAALLFWGRGAYCGWLCPFGALQELLNNVAKMLRIPQVPVPFGVHQRVWPVKYIIFLVLFGLSLYSLGFSEQVSEVEPFKTAIILNFMRSWPFVLYALVILFAGLFIERFYCRYLCPLGGALAIPARMRMFDWLRRYRECGNPCQRCANDCPVQAIHPEGHINPNECIQCLNCQVLYHDDQRCPVMIQKRLKRERFAALAAGVAPPPRQPAAREPSA